MAPKRTFLILLKMIALWIFVVVHPLQGTLPRKRDNSGRSLEVQTPTYKKYFAGELDIRGGHISNFAREIPAFGGFQTCLTRKPRLNDSRVP